MSDPGEWLRDRRPLRDAPATPGEPGAFGRALLRSAAPTEVDAAEVARGWRRIERHGAAPARGLRTPLVVAATAVVAISMAAVVLVVSRRAERGGEGRAAGGQQGDPAPARLKARPLLAPAPAPAPPAPLSAPGAPIWSTDHETGDLADWRRGGVGHRLQAGLGTIGVTTARARSGRHALEARLAAGPPGFSQAAVAREGELPQAYFRAWYFIPTDTIPPRSWWSLMLFRSRVEAHDPSTWLDVWNLNVHRRRDGGLAIALFMHGPGEFPPEGANAHLPLGRWFPIEVFLRAASDDTGRLVVWIDGRQAFDVRGRSTMPSAFVSWVVGSLSAEGREAVVYVDDASIAPAAPGR